MARRCQISNKGLQYGNNVSHANNKKRKTWQPNLKSKRIFDSESGKWVRLKVSSQILRTIDKKGLSATLKDFGLKIADVSA